MSRDLGIPDIGFAQLIEVLREGLWVVDRDGVTVFCNPRMADMLHTTADDMAGTPLVDWFHEPDRQLARDMWRRRTQGRPDTYEARLCRTDGAIIHVRLDVSPLLNDDRVVGAVAAVTDITELRRASQERENALRVAQDANEATMKFLSWISHELRTPLTTISGFAQLLEAGLTGEADRQAASNILAASLHINGLVQDLLDYSRADANVLEPTLVPVGLRDALDEALSLVAGTAREHHVHFVVRAGDHVVVADRRHLVQVLTNLLSNAVKYGGDNSDVDVTTELADHRVRCSVSDHGPGISQHQQTMVFRPFQRLDNSHGVVGAGLGLAIADAYVRAMHGSLSIDSEPGHGATFVIDLPAAEPVPTPTSSPSTQLVLYVEDEPLNASLVKSIVSLLPGRELHVETTVAGGIEALSRLSPALVLLDLNLPDGSGFELLKAIRADWRCADLPVFMLSADATEQATGTARELGADRFITKPFDLKEFLRLIEAATS